MAMNIRKMLIPALLALSFIGNLAWLCISVAPKEEKPIIGTYCSEDASSYAAADHGEYLVFTKDGTYTRYRQLEVLERGAYRWEKPIFFLEETAGYFDGKDTVVLFNGQEATTYSRFSDVPTYINVSGEN